MSGGDYRRFTSNAATRFMSALTPVRRAFLDSLIRRGLMGIKLIVSDDHAGLKAARRAALPSVPWQRCQFHLQQNAQACVNRIEQCKPVAQRIRSIFNAPDKAEAERLLKQSVEIWTKEAPNSRCLNLSQRRFLPAPRVRSARRMRRRVDVRQDVYQLERIMPPLPKQAA